MLNETERRRVKTHAPSQFLEATILDPPLSGDGWMRVEIDNRPGVVELCPWMAQAEIDPEPQDAALVAESDGGNFWVVAWWSQSGA